MRGGIRNAVKDENTIIFTKKDQSEFQRSKEAIDRQRSISETVSHPPSNLDELEKLAELRDKGIITEENSISRKDNFLRIKYS